MALNEISAYQKDQAVLLADRIERKTGDSVSPDRIQAVLIKNGVVSDYSAWMKIPAVLEDLGYSYDEIFEVAP